MFNCFSKCSYKLRNPRRIQCLSKVHVIIASHSQQLWKLSSKFPMCCSNGFLCTFIYVCTMYYVLCVCISVMSMWVFFLDTYIDQARVISVFDVVQDGCLIETRQLGHILDFVELWRIHLLYVIA